MAVILTKDEYYTAMALYIVASKKQREVRELELQMNAILKDSDGTSIATDTIYTGFGTKEEFDKALDAMGITLDWTK